MSLDKCIPSLVFEGKLTDQQGRKLTELYTRYQRHFRRTMAEGAADALASETTMRTVERETKLRKYQILLQIKAQKRMLADMARFDGGSGKHPGAAAMAIFDHDGRAPYMNVEAQRKAILGRAHAYMTDILFKHSRDMLGRVRRPAELRELVRAAFGEAVDNANAVELAEAWGEASDYLRKRFNAAGGAIGKLEKWGLPQSHSSEKVRAAAIEDPRMIALRARLAEAKPIDRPAIEREMNDLSFTTWRDFIAPLLDRAKMIDEGSGMPFDGETLNLVLRDVFDTIRSDGLNKIVPGGVAGRAKLANSRNDSRFLIFRDADAWMAYADRFGTADAYDAMMGHMAGMARDIAHMEVLGPNPSASVRWLKDGLMKAAAIDADPSGTKRIAASAAAFRVGQLFDATSGALASPVNPKVAYAFGNVRSALTAAKLGGAMLSATTDVAFQAVTRKFNGLPVAGVLGDYIRLLNPANTADRRVAVRLGLIADQAAQMAATQNRFLGETVTGELTSRLAEMVMRGSGLSPWTQAGRWSFGMEMLGYLGSHLAPDAVHAFANLDPAVQASLQRYGIGEADWAILQRSPLLEHGGAHFLDPTQVPDRALGDSILRMVLTETGYAVPEATVRARSMMTFGQPGTLAGEISRNAGLFKSFGVSMLLTHGARAMQQQGWNKAAYAAGLFVTTTLIGALSMQLKDLAKGKDARPMTGLDPEEALAFWGSAALQGGGFGIFGDFLGQATSDRASGQGSFADALAGPVVGLGTDTAALTIGNAATAIRGKDPHLGRDVTRAFRSYTPGSTLWYGRLALDRLVWDQLQMQIDPDYPKAYARMHQRAREGGQDYWWNPGEAAPERAPTMATD